MLKYFLLFSFAFIVPSIHTMDLAIFDEQREAITKAEQQINGITAQIDGLMFAEKITFQDYVSAQEKTKEAHNFVTKIINETSNLQEIQKAETKAQQRIAELTQLLNKLQRDEVQSTSVTQTTTSPIQFNELQKRSETFVARVKFPTINNRIAHIAGNDPVKQNQVAKHAQNSYPILHKKVLTLIDEFIEHKKKNGSAIEKGLYANLTREAFIDRLLSKRPLMFINSNDSYVLRDGITSKNGGFEAIGKDNESAPLLLKDYISYDEIQIAALLGVSVPTYFINDGNRHNCGEKGQPNTFEEQGVYVGLVGARFEKPGLMEWQHMIITPEQNTPENGYGLTQNKTPKTLLALWSKFYGLAFPTYQEAKADKSGRYISFENGQKYFDSYVYKERLRLVIEPFLIDANNRGKEQKKKVYVHTVGLGLGVWKKIPAQESLMLEVYADCLMRLNLQNISDLDFSYFSENSIMGITDNKYFPSEQNNIKVHFSKRNPADKLKGEHNGKLLVACYAWDGNSYPGNEYWIGALFPSGDPAAACCSTIAELQNPEINYHVSGKNLHTFE